MKSAEIRETFLKFFENYHHQRVKSSSLVPAGDATLLFTNAGMNQFKDCFLGLHDPGYKRATSSQKCVRAGGKHNDLENVGFTARHHTFFEMLGNFSFGDYFKQDAIRFAWELLTRHYHIPQEKLRVTVFREDDDAFELWKGQGVRPDFITRLDEKDNFWMMGDTGPCGPCTEIYYDWGDKYGCGKPKCAPGCDCERFVEIWNLVFMQYNRSADGKMEPLPKPSVDTGAGLERVSAVLQGVHNNYDTDLFTPIIHAVCELTGKKYHADKNLDVSMRVIADHMRSGTFLISDGVTPSNEGRGYVLRRILRRAIRHGKKLGQDQPFLYKLVGAVADVFSSVYPELQTSKKIVEVVLKEEETRFHETLHRGMGLLEETISSLRQQKKNTIPGEVAFKLYDTFGFPYDLIQVIAAENSLTVDEAAFNERMDKQRAQSSQSKKFDSAFTVAVDEPDTEFLRAPSTQEEKLVRVFNSDYKPVDALNAGQKGFLVFPRTPFYAEGGGQVGDSGVVVGQGGEARVVNTTKSGGVFLHHVEVSQGSVQKGKSYRLKIDGERRRLTAANHTGTHVLHAALRKVLGDRVKQAGSLVNSDRLRFDFTYPRAVGESDLVAIENLANAEIAKHYAVEHDEMAYDDAMKTGAIAFFEEKYGDKVRVLKVGDFSVELCGGTHVRNTSEIEYVKILSESSVASGVRRIEAVTSTNALRYLNDRSKILESLEAKLNVKGDGLALKVDQLVSQVKQLQRENEDLKLKVASSAAKGSSGGGALHDKAFEVKGKGIKAVIEQVEGGNAKILRSLVDQVRDKLPEKTIIVLGSESEGKAAICVGLTKDLVGTYDAAQIIKPLAEVVGGTGGGRADFAQAGGSKPENLGQALEKCRGLLTT